MNPECAEFRARLAERGASAVLRSAGGLAHARACRPCSVQLRREQELDRLLDVAPQEPAPAQLAARVLARLAPQRESPGLGVVLESVVAPAAPPGLAGRVLAGLAPKRAAAHAPRRTRRRALLLAVAAAALVGLALWGWRLRSRDATPAPVVVEGDAPHSGAPDSRANWAGATLEHDEELIAYALERWELLHDDDLDLWFASLDPEEELLMELSAGDALRDMEETRSARPR